jgi:hypothetical protein
MRYAGLIVGRDYKPGDPAPDGYLAWHEWADVQAAAGLEQVQCETCRLWRFPQELPCCPPRSRPEVPAVSMPASFDPYGDNRPTHLARLMGDDGKVSPWCAKKPRALPKRARYVVFADNGVTCKRCLAAYSERATPAPAGDEGADS